MTPEIISAVASLWKLVLSIALVLFIILFRTRVKLFFDRFKNFKLKKGTTELTINDGEQNVTSLQQYRNDEIKRLEPHEEIDQIDKSTSENKFGHVLTSIIDNKLEEAETYFHKLQEETKDIAEQLKNQVFYYSLTYFKTEDSEYLEKLKALTENEGNTSLTGGRKAISFPNSVWERD